MMETLADPQYQETVHNLSPAEQQHMDEQMGGMGSAEATVTYMRGLVSFKQQHPGVSLTEVDANFQRPPRSDHPAEQQGGDSGYYAAAGGGALLGGGMLSTGGGYQRLGESALYQGEGVEPQTMVPETLGDAGVGELSGVTEGNPIFDAFDSQGDTFRTRAPVGGATGDPAVDGRLRQRGGFQFTEQNPAFAESGADVAAGEGASLLGGVGDALGTGARVVGAGARFGAGRAVGGIVVVGGLVVLGGAAAVEVFGDDAPPSGNIGAPAAFTGRPPPPPPPDDTADTAQQGAVDPNANNQHDTAEQDAVDNDGGDVMPGGDTGKVIMDSSNGSL